MDTETNSTIAPTMINMPAIASMGSHMGWFSQSPGSTASDDTLPRQEARA